jgi:hypothetical protein
MKIHVITIRQYVGTIKLKLIPNQKKKRITLSGLHSLTGKERRIITKLFKSSRLTSELLPKKKQHKGLWGKK